MKKEVVGNILDVNSGIIVQQVNAQGVMNGGVAKMIRDRYPVVFEDYQRVVGQQYTQPKSGFDLLGNIVISDLSTNLYVVSTITQQFFGREKKRYTSYDALDVAFEKIAHMAKMLNTPVHYPLIGAGLGGGSWKIISAIIDDHLATVDHTLWRLPTR